MFKVSRAETLYAFLHIGEMVLEDPGPLCGAILRSMGSRKGPFLGDSLDWRRGFGTLLGTQKCRAGPVETDFAALGRALEGPGRDQKMAILAIF